MIHDKLSNLTESLTNIGSRLEKVEERARENETTINELKDSIEFTQSLIDQKIEDLAEHSKNKLT